MIAEKKIEEKPIKKKPTKIMKVKVIDGYDFDNLYFQEQTEELKKMNEEIQKVSENAP